MSQPLRNYLPGFASLLEQIDRRVLVLLRDGRTLFGILRSIDQFANLVLHLTVERIYIGNEFGEIDRGVFLIRGENVVLCGEIVSNLTIYIILTLIYKLYNLNIYIIYLSYHHSYTHIHTHTQHNICQSYSVHPKGRRRRCSSPWIHKSPNRGHPGQPSPRGTRREQ